MSEDARSEVLVDTAWVENHLDDETVRIVEVDVDPTVYESGHIPGAVGWDWTTQLQADIQRDIANKEQFETLASWAGISRDTTVILYGDNNNWFAAYAFWLFKIYGHRDVRLMDGGRRKWIEEERPLTEASPEVGPTRYQASDPDSDLRALQPEVRHHVGLGGLLVDVRSPAEFTGEVLAPPGLPETAQRGGHIPGARNVPWSQAVAGDGTFKPADELRELYEAQAVKPEDDVIVYCRIGERSSHSWFVLKYLLGFENVRNYDGSWTEWGSMVGMPIERGEKALA